MLKTYLEISLGMSAVILLILAFTPVFRRHYRSAMRYIIWIFCAIMLIIPYRPAPKISIAIPKTESISEFAKTADNALIAEPDIANETGEDMAELSEAKTANMSIAPITTDTQQRKTFDWTIVMTLLWLIGAAVFILYHIAAYILFLRKIRPWRRNMTIDGYNEKPKLIYCKIVKTPMLVGFFKPQILLPRTDYSDMELEMILNHELTHFKRGDLWIKLLLVAANALHWFNPAVYIMRKHANGDMEYSCDEQVVRGKDREFRQAYSMMILNCAAGGMNTAFSTYFSEDRKGLKQRFSNILSGKKKRGIIIGAAIVLIAAMCAGAFVLVNEPQTQDNYLLLGTDGRGNIDMLMTGELKDGSLEVTFIPRDKVRKYLPSEITTKSAEKLRDTIEELTEKSLDKYAVIDVNHAEKLLETLGSVSIWMPDLYNDGVGMAYDDPYQDLHISIPVGENMLDASGMMDVIRYRKNNMDDSGQYNSYKNPDSDRASATINLLKEIVKQKTPSKYKNDNILRTAELVCSSADIKNITLSDIEAVYKAVIKGKVNFNLFGSGEGFDKYEIYAGDNEEVVAEKLKTRYKKIYGEEENLYAGVGGNFCMPVPEGTTVEEYDLNGATPNGIEKMWNVTAPDGEISISVVDKIMDIPGSEKVLKQRFYNTPWKDGEISPYAAGEYTITDYMKFLFTVNPDTDDNRMGYYYTINFSEDSAYFIIEAPISDTKTLRIVANIKTSDEAVRKNMIDIAKSVEIVK